MENSVARVYRIAGAKWIAERTQGIADAKELPLASLLSRSQLEGLDFTAKQFDSLMEINSQEWVAECESQQRYFKKLGDLMPGKMIAQAELTMEHVKNL